MAVDDNLGAGSPAHRGDDPESVDSQAPEGLDLTPRAPKPAHARSQRVAVYGVLTLVVVAGGFVLVQGLSSATTFFYNVDEALKKRDEIGDRRVRIQGHAVADSIEERPDGVDFTLRYGGESVDVSHSGPVPDLFDPEIPSVVVGQFSGDVFVSDDILVKHDETYEEDNGDRLEEAEDDV